MDFPHAQMQATLAATNFSPAEVALLYAQPDKSQRNAHLKESFIQPSRISEEGKIDTGGDQDQRRASRKSSIRKFGSLFGRERSLRSSIANRSPLTAVVNSERADDDTSMETERSVQPATFTDSTETDSSMSSMKKDKIRERRE